MKKHVTAFAAFAAGTALFVSACGGGGESEPAAQEPAAAQSAAGGGDGAKTIQIEAKDFAFAPGTVDLAAPGTYTFVVANTGKAEHALQIDGPGIEQTSETIGPGGETQLTVEITEPGQYEIYCPVAGHRDMGMEGTLNAKAS